MRRLKTFDITKTKDITINMSEDESLTIYIKTNNSMYKINFKKAIDFLYISNKKPSALYEILEDSPFITQALEREYVNIPINHPFKLYEMLDESNFTFMQIVAESVHILESELRL